jgi:hypothetical protein
MKDLIRSYHQHGLVIHDSLPGNGVLGPEAEHNADDVFIASRTPAALQANTSRRGRRKPGRISPPPK